MIKVMLADDEDLVRSGLRTILCSAGDIEVVAECDDGLFVADLARQHRPHVVLLDIRMRSADGLVALRRLRSLPEPPQVAMLTTFDVDEYVTEALRIGASGFLLKDTEPHPTGPGRARPRPRRGRSRPGRRGTRAQRRRRR